MKYFIKIGLIILILVFSQQAFPQEENAKGSLTGEQQIELSEGYSFVSSRIIPENSDMLAVLASVLNENLDFIRNSQGEVLRKIGPNWVNNIGDWIVEEGYLFKMLANDSFNIEGETVDPTTPIPLTTGFQFVSYFLETPLDALVAFETIISDNLDFIRNSQGQILRKIGPNWINGIGDCNPGEGYLVKMFSDDVLFYFYSGGEPCPGIPTVTYEGQIYNTVLIGEQCWLKENLNVGIMINDYENMTDNGVIEKYCYDNNIENCDEYGGLYQWDEMMQYVTTTFTQGICPPGWHLPHDYEWKILEGTVDSQYPVGNQVWDFEGFRGFDAGLNLKSTYGWFNNGNGTDIFGFKALPGGIREHFATFDSLSYKTSFWCSLEVDPAYA